jgi:hypothetical protein
MPLIISLKFDLQAHHHGGAIAAAAEAPMVASPRLAPWPWTIPGAVTIVGRNQRARRHPAAQ